MYGPSSALCLRAKLAHWVASARLLLLLLLVLRPSAAQDATVAISTDGLVEGSSARDAFLDIVMGDGKAPRDAHDLQHRRLAAATLGNFRAVETKGMRGFLEGGTFINSSPGACALRCAADPLCLSFDFETITLVCYVSHTDRYAHPEAFLDFPTGVYYEWHGVLAMPELEPNGGLFTTQIAASLFTNKLGAVIYYHVESLTTAATLALTADSIFGANQTFGVARNGDLITLPPYSCKVFAMAAKEGMTSSPIVVSSDYIVFAPKYAFLVPYFNGQFHGRVVRLKLDVKGKKRPRPARFLEFSDYESEMGIGPYSGQVSVVNLTTVNPDFKGFYGGLTAFAQTAFVNETYTVPAPDDANYSILKWRLVFEAQYTPHATHAGFGTPPRVLQSSEYLCLAPFFNGANYLGTIIRILTLTFSDTPFIQQLNLTKIDPDLKGFGSSFTDGAFAYFVPRENENGLFGKMVRIRMDDFNATGTTVLDLAAIDPRFVGFHSATAYNGFAYLVPMIKPLTLEQKTVNYREFPVANSGLLVRVNLQTFSSAAALDLAATHPELVGFSGAVRVANYLYMIPCLRRRVPWSAEFNPYSSLVARVDLRDFRSVAYFDLAQVDNDLRGFARGFAYKQFVIFVPSRSKYYSPGTRAQSGKVARLDTTLFSPDGVSVLDLATSYRSQVPDRPNDFLRGFSDGFVSGKYGYFVPFFDGGLFSGKICRINLEKFDEVQMLDLTMLDNDLRGYSQGILSKMQEALDTDLFGEFQIRQGTTTPYEYVY